MDLTHCRLCWAKKWKAYMCGNNKTFAAKETVNKLRMSMWQKRNFAFYASHVLLITGMNMYNTGWFRQMDSVSHVYIFWTIHGMWMIYITFERGGPKFSNTTRWMLKRRRNARCTAVAYSVLMNSRSQKILCYIVAILLSTDAAARVCARRAL